MNYLQQIGNLPQWVDITKIELMKVVEDSLIIRLSGTSNEISYDIGREEAIIQAKLIARLTKLIPTTRMSEARRYDSSDEE